MIFHTCSLCTFFIVHSFKCTGNDFFHTHMDDLFHLSFSHKISSLPVLNSTSPHNTSTLPSPSHNSISTLSTFNSTSSHNTSTLPSPSRNSISSLSTFNSTSPHKSFSLHPPSRSHLFASPKRLLPFSQHS